MYKNGYVLSIIKNGLPIREVDGKVTIPFGSEYAIKIRNKTDNRASVDLFVDGTKTSELGSYVIGSHSYIMIERFMGHSLEHGKRFKFVSINDPAVNDPHSNSNGVVEVKIRAEKGKNFIGLKPLEPWIKKWPPIFDDVETYTSEKKHTVEMKSQHFNLFYPTSDSNSLSNINCQYVSCFSNDFSPGATVEGERSGQKFEYVNGFDLEDAETVLRLKLVGPSQSSLKEKFGDTFTTRIYCSNCGRRKKRSERFCPQCGRKYTT